jgi:hypothetical protein
MDDDRDNKRTKIDNIDWKDVTTVMFRPAGKNSKGTDTFKCTTCPEESPPIANNCANGYSNIKTHLQSSKHPNWKNDYEMCKQSNRGQLQMIDAKSKNIYNHLEFIIAKSLPFSLVDDELYRKAIKYDKICRKTLMKGLDILFDCVKESVTDEMPKKIVLMFDGWTDNKSQHFLATFAIYMKDGVRRQRLIALKPLPDLTNFTAENHKVYMEQVLALYGRYCY